MMMKNMIMIIDMIMTVTVECDNESCFMCHE